MQIHGLLFSLVLLVFVHLMIWPLFGVYGFSGRELSSVHSKMAVEFH